MVAVLDLLSLIVYRRPHRVKVTLSERGRLRNDSVDVIVAWFLGLACDNLVDVACCAAVDVVLEGHMASVAGEVLLLVVDRHSNKTY